MADGQGDRPHWLEKSKSMARVMILVATILAAASATQGGGFSNAETPTPPATL